jgi:hypothetical protein
VAEYGSELYILSVYGITSIRDLLEGTPANELRTSPAAKVARFLRADIEKALDAYEWSINVFPGDGFMQVVAPKPATTDYVQYNQNLSTKAWGFWEGVPMICGGAWEGEYYLGGTGGVVYIYDGVLDGTTLDDVNSGEPIGFRTLTSFQSYESHPLNKMVGLIRTIGVVAGTVSFNVQAVYDYDVSAPLQAPASVGPPSDSVWNSAIWNADSWAFTVTSEDLTLGASGIGRTIAIGLSGTAANRINVVGWDIIFKGGGFL